MAWQWLVRQRYCCLSCRPSCPPSLSSLSAGARQFAADVSGLAQLFAPYTRRGGAGAGAGAGGAAAGGQHFRELQAAARLLCLGDEEAADVMRRASAAAVAARAGVWGLCGSGGLVLVTTPS